MSIFKTFEFATQSQITSYFVFDNQQMNYLLYFVIREKAMNNAIIDAACISTQNGCVKKKIEKSIMNFSESRQNRSRENRDKSKNQFFFPPLVCMCLCMYLGIDLGACTMHV